MPQKISALFVCSSPNVWDFFKKLSLSVRGPCHPKNEVLQIAWLFFCQLWEFCERKPERIEVFFHKIRILVVPLLKTLYSADERNNHHTYMSLIILLILSEDEFFNGMYLVFLHFVIRPTKCNECFPENR